MTKHDEIALYANDGLKTYRKLGHRLCFFYGTLTSGGTYDVARFVEGLGYVAIYIGDAECPKYALREICLVPANGQEITPTCTLDNHPLSKDIAHAKGQLWLVPEEVMVELDTLEVTNFGVKFLPEEVYVELTSEESDTEVFSVHNGFVTAYIARFDPAYGAAPDAFTRDKCLGDFVRSGSWAQQLAQTAETAETE